VRPNDLIETTERATLDGLTRSELAQLRPKLRPVSPQETAEQTAAVAAAVASASLLPSDATPAAPLSEQGSDAALASATDQAVAESLRPDARPGNFGAIVERATAEEAEEEEAEAEAPVQTASVAPRSVSPSIPSSASVSREATEANAINLRRVNLIGVYGKPSDRRALVRLPNGRFQKVQVGDRIDGGRISAIGDSELRYQKGSRNLVLKMP
jgi:type IV pilus biogenesis protein PilP